MPITYEQCGQDIHDQVQRVINKYHPELAKAGVTIGLLFARADEGKPAVKHGGYPCAAKVRKTSLKDRANGIADAEIIIDEAGWVNLSEDEQLALLDHELYHLIPKHVDNNERKPFDLDDLGRPKLQMRLHDAQVGIFKEVIKRHKMNCLDAQIAEKFVDEYGQLLMWAKDHRMVG